MQWLADRVKEPSTYAAVAALLGLIGVKMTPEQYQWLVATGAAIAAAAGIVLPEQHS